MVLLIKLTGVKAITFFLFCQKWTLDYCSRYDQLESALFYLDLVQAVKRQDLELIGKKVERGQSGSSCYQLAAKQKGGKVKKAKGLSKNCLLSFIPRSTRTDVHHVSWKSLPTRLNPIDNACGICRYLLVHGQLHYAVSGCFRIDWLPSHPGLQKISMQHDHGSTSSKLVKKIFIYANCLTK